MRLIVGISGTSGVIYGIRLLEELRKNRDVEIHLILTKAAETIIREETGLSKENVEALATHHYEIDCLTAPIASGSFRTDGMIVIPCSTKTLSGIAYGYSDNLLLRAADVTLKENRHLILVPRETPLSPIHLRNMLELSRIGVTILPAMPAFYHKPRTIDDMVNFVVGRALDILRIEHSLYQRWGMSL